MQRENNKFIQLGRITTYKLLTSPPSCPDYYTQHALTSSKGSTVIPWSGNWPGIIQKCKTSFSSTICSQFQAVNYINNFQEALPERDGDGKFVGKLKLKCFVTLELFSGQLKNEQNQYSYFENQFLRGHKEQHRKL